MSNLAIPFLTLSEHDAERVDGLCSACWLPSLWRVEFDMLTGSGVTPNAAFWIGCIECPGLGDMHTPVDPA